MPDLPVGYYSNALLEDRLAAAARWLAVSKDLTDVPFDIVDLLNRAAFAVRYRRSRFYDDDSE